MRIQLVCSLTSSCLVLKALETWLRPPERQPTNYQKKRLPGSCEWFFDDRFEDWKSREKGVFWVHGNGECFWQSN